MSASELFARYFTDEVWQLIVGETNRYAASCRQNLSDHSRPWTPVTVADIKAFIGMVILMGIVKSPQLDLYWSTKHPLIRIGFSEVMSCVRFENRYGGISIFAMKTMRYLGVSLAMTSFQGT